MQISSRPAADHAPIKSHRLLRASALLSAVALFASAGLSQTLARPGWVGSGLTSQAWWQSAVIYRVEPQRFQDSDGDGIGDLRGLAERLDYLQSIGVDAVLIEGHSNDPGFDDLISEASRRHIRILIELEAGAPAQALSSEQALAQARLWLRRGVAGIYVPAALLNALAAHTSAQQVGLLLQEMRSAADSFPGERVIIAGNSPSVGIGASAGPHSGPELVDGVIPVTPWDAATLRSKLVLADSPDAGAPLLQIAREPSGQPGRDRILAALLLSSRAAVSISFGAEIGLDGNASAPLMQWTPSNLTKPQAKPIQETNGIHYGPYRPYVRPAPRSVVGSRPDLPHVALNTEALPPPVDPDTLPGFSTRESAVSSSPETHPHNVASEDTNPDSLLNFYRRVLELHSGNATMRTGAVTFFDHNSEGALVWLRRAPAGARTVASVVVLCNVTDRPIQLSIADDLKRLHVGGRYLDPLLTSLHMDHVSQAVGSIRLSPHSVFVGSLGRY